MYRRLFIHSPAEGHLSCFQVLAIMNKAALQLLRPVSSRFLSSQVSRPMVRLLD